ncbi:MAG: RodZ domain-containing protein [Candidatus Omnitrophota bacterium]
MGNDGARAMETIGARLKKIRLEKGRSLEDVHRDTKIHFNVLRALEEDSLMNYSPVYIKGFLKIYCHYLGVNPDEFIIEAKKSKPSVETIGEVKKQALPDNKPSVFISAAAALLKFIRGKVKIIIGIVIVFFLLMGLFKIGKFMILKIGQWSKRPKTEAVVSISKQKEKPAPAAKRSKKNNSVVKTENKAAVSSGVKLTIRAKDNCWLQVKSDGKNIFQGILRKGRVEGWKANEKIELSVGNAGVLELEVNGKILSSLGRKGQSIKNILITKDGLSTSR